MHNSDNSGLPYLAQTPESIHPTKDPLEAGIAAMMRDGLESVGQFVRDIMAYGVAHPLTAADRLKIYAAQYAAAVWPDLPTPEPSAEDLERMQVRADGYANAHVEGEHTVYGECRWSDPTECGERAAAAEYVEST